MKALRRRAGGRGPGSAKGRLSDRPRSGRASSIPAPSQVQALYEINKLLGSLDRLEDAVPQIASVLARGAVPLDSLVISRATDDVAETVEWRSAGTEPDITHQSYEIAWVNLGYRVTREGAYPPPSSMRPTATQEPRLRLVLPLASASGRMFGVAQLVPAAPIDETDLGFLATLVMDVAAALDRRVAERAATAELRAAEATIQELMVRVANVEAGCWSAEWVHHRLETLVDGLTGAFVWEANARDLALVYVSAGVDSVLGYSCEKLLQREFFLDAVHVDDRAAFEAQLQAATQQLEDRRFLHRCVDSAGAVRWFQTSLHCDDGGAARRLFGITLDVSELQWEREQMERELDVTGTLSGSLTDGIIAFDRELRLTFINGPAAKALGLSQTQVRGVPIAEILELRVTARASSRAPADLAQLVKAPEPTRLDEALLSAQGGPPVLVRLEYVPIRGTPDPEGGILMFRSIGEAKWLARRDHFLAQLSTVLGASLEYRSTIASIARLCVPFFADVAVIHELDEEGKPKGLEVAYAESAKRPPEREVAQPAVSQLQLDVFNSGKPLLVPTMTSSDDSAFAASIEAVSALVVPVETAGKRLGTLTFFTCGSGRKYSQEDVPLAETIAYRAAVAVQNAKLYRKVQEAVRARQDVLAVVAHDLRGPLANISMSVAMLLNPAVDMRLASRNLGIIQRSATRMESMLQDLLDGASIEVGRLAIQTTAVSLRALLEETREIGDAIGYRRSVGFRCEPVRGDVELYCDRGRILQVMTNLIDNGVKYSAPGGTVTLRVAIVDGRARFEVHDEGPGIPAAKAERVFDRYWQAKETAHEGRGLGLYIAKGIVESHGGDIWCDGGEGRGATFGFTLPLARPFMEGILPPAATVRRLVMVVDDDPTMREALQAILESKGFRVAVARDGAEALHQLSTNELPSLILLDLRMPRLDGWSFLARRARSASLRDIPVIITSADLDAAKRAAGSGARFVAKPIEPDALFEAITATLH